MKRILSIDGGGIRGLIPAVVCSKLESWGGASICKMFDLIAGTSTGGILAMGLAAPPTGRPAQTLTDFYKIEGPKIFAYPRGIRRHWSGPKYDSWALRNSLQVQFGSLTLKDSVVELLVPAYDIEHRRPIYFTRSKALVAPSDDLLMSEVGVATSAAPTYFAPARIGNHVVIDGGMVANNPTGAAYAHAKQLWPDEDLLVVSMGTGTLTGSISPSTAESWGTLNWVEHIIDCVFDGSAKATEDFFRYSHLKNYWRFQGGLSENNRSLDAVSPEALANLEQIGDQIAYNNEKILIDLAKLLIASGVRLEARISSPQKEEVVPSGECVVVGSISGYSGELLYLFTGTEGNFWPSSRIVPRNGFWTARVHFGTYFPEGTITLLAVDQQLADYIEFYRSISSSVSHRGISLSGLPNHLDKIHVIVHTNSGG